MVSKEVNFSEGTEGPFRKQQAVQVRMICVWGGGGWGMRWVK